MKQISTRCWLLFSLAILIMMSGYAVANQEDFDKMGVAIPKKREKST